MVTLYSKPQCVQCSMTKKAFDRADIAYREVDVTASAAALEYATEELGYSMAPVVVVDDQTHWAGIRPDKISTLAA